MTADPQGIAGDNEARLHTQVGESAKYRLGLIAAGLLLSSWTQPSAGASDSNPSDSKVTVTFSTVVATIGDFVLLRRGQHFAAIRFLTAEKARDAISPTVFQSGEATYSATYECYSRDDGVQAFEAGHYVHVMGSLSSGRIKGIGRWAVRSGHNELRCGSFKLPWFPPTAIGFERQMSLAAADGTEMAPTAIAEVEHLDGRRSCLVWYRHTSDRPPIRLRLNQLCR